MKREAALRSNGRAPFALVLADATADQIERDRLASKSENNKLRRELAALRISEGSDVPSASGNGTYGDEIARDKIADPSMIMLEAVRRFETALTSHPALSAAELKRLRRKAAIAIHPDHYDGSHREMAEELMKQLNALVTEALTRLQGARAK